MTSSLHVGREVVLLAILLLVLAVGLGLRSRAEGDDGPGPGSTLSAKPEGAKALYLLYARLGRPVGRSTDPPGDFGDARLAFLISPEVPLGHADLAGLRGWVERGGTLVYGYAGDEPDSKPLRDVLGIEVLGGAGRAKPLLRLDPGFLPAKVVSVPAAAGVRARRDREAFVAITDEIGMAGRRSGARASAGPSSSPSDEPVALAMLRVGEGRVVLLPGAALGNRLLGDADNAVFAALLVERYVGDGPVVFDEWSHGEGGSTSALGLQRVPLDAGLALLALAFVLYALAGRRLGPPSQEPPPARRATIEQVVALARFYQKTGARQAAILALRVPATTAPRSDAELVRLVRAALPMKGV